MKDLLKRGGGDICLAALLIKQRLLLYESVDRNLRANRTGGYMIPVRNFRYNYYSRLIFLYLLRINK